MTQLKFDNNQDFLDAEFFKENYDGSIFTKHGNWQGSIWEGFTRTDSEGNEIDVWNRLHELHNDPNSLVTILPADMEPIKESAKQVINSQRDVLIKGGIDYLGNNYQTDDESIMNMMGAIITGSSVTWFTSDNQEVTLTATEIAGLGQAVAARKQTLVYLARSYKDHVDTLTDKASIESYLDGLTWE